MKSPPKSEDEIAEIAAFAAMFHVNGAFSIVLLEIPAEISGKPSSSIPVPRKSQGGRGERNEKEEGKKKFRVERNEEERENMRLGLVFIYIGGGAGFFFLIKKNRQ